MKNLALVILAAAAVACGGSSNPPASPSNTTSSDTHEGGGEHAHHKESGGHDDHHAGISPALKDFHHVLAPVWHSEPGATRVTKACADVKTMKDKAAATSDSELVTDVAALETACASPDKKDAEAKLSTVHDRFHALAKDAQKDSKKDAEEKKDAPKN